MMNPRTRTVAEGFVSPSITPTTQPTGYPITSASLAG